MVFRYTTASIFTLLFLSACSGFQDREDLGIVPTAEKDGGPDKAMEVVHIPDAVPRVEPRTSAGNKSPYKVLGITYHLMSSPDNYKEKGLASWYGTKFHGRRTSNGEIYDMYGMTAAHKTLPIPSFVRVTNLSNGRSAIVRVNDRGPFHEGRIIDLTYTAAKKLGFVAQGTAKVEVEYIDPLKYEHKKDQGQKAILMASSQVPSDQAASDQVVAGQVVAGQVAAGQVAAGPASSGPASLALEPKPGSSLISAAADNASALAPQPKNSAGYAIPDNTFLQVGAYSAEETAKRMQQRLSAMTEYPVNIIRPKLSGSDDVDVREKESSATPSWFRVHIGPLKDNFDLVMLRQVIIDANLPEPHVVYR